jgi:hypothetical protein
MPLRSVWTIVLDGAGWRKTMRMVGAVAAVLMSMGAAHAEKVTASGQSLLLYQAFSTNPDCTSTGKIIMRMTQGPQHGRVTIRPAGVFPNFAESNIRSACNRRRVPGVQAVYVSQRGYLGPDFVELQILFPAGAERSVKLPISVK